MKKFKFNVKGMHCNSCSALIENQLKDKTGVEMCKISHETGKGVVVYNEDKTSENEVKEIVEGAGDYQVTQEEDDSLDNGEPKTMEKSNQGGKSSKMMFAFGIVVGIAILAIVGLIWAVSTRPSSDGGQDQVATGGTGNPGNPNNQAPPPPRVVDIEVSQSDHIRGNFDAPVTIIEYSDFQCPFCGRFDSTMKQVVANYPNDVRWVYKHFPLDSIHPFARKAAEASECAAEQDKFWEYSDELYANQSSINLPFLKEAAKSVGLNTGKFDECLDSGKFASKVNDDYREGISAGVSGTPGNIINGELISGALPYDQMVAIIDSILNQ